MRTSLRVHRLLVAQRALYGTARMEDPPQGQGQGQQQGQGQGQQQGQQPPPKEDPPKEETETGFPPDTPVNQMTPVQQAAYWKHHSRKHENTARVNAAALAQKEQEAAELRKQTETATEKAIREAREDAAKTVRSELGATLVATKFEALSAGRIGADRLAGLLEDIDLSKYLTDKGEVDAEKIRKKVDVWAPTEEQNPPGKGGRRLPPLGQGERDGAKPSKKDQGLAMAEKRFGKPAGA